MIRLHHGYELDDAFDRIDFTAVHQWLTNTYWSPGITRDTVEKGARHSSLVLGAYLGPQQVGYARVVSDRTRFAYICDVYIDEPHRGKRLGKAVVRFGMDHPSHSDVRVWCLRTRDAHGVYSALGFTPIPDPENWMSQRRITP